MTGRLRFVLFAVACAFAGACALLAHAPQAVFPRIVLARVEVFVDAGDLPSESVRRQLAMPLEAALANAPHVRAIRAYSDPGKLEVELDFDPAVASADDLRAVRSIVDDVRPRLSAARDIHTIVEGAEEEPVVTYAISAAGTTQAELETAVRAALVPVFTGTPDLGRLTVFGGPHPAFRVELDPKQLARYGLDAAAVSNAVRAAATTSNVAGVVVRRHERLTVLAGTAPDDASSLGALAVRGSHGENVSLRDLGAVGYGEVETGRQASFDGKHAVLLNAYVTGDGDAVRLADEVRDRLPALRANLPADATITLAWDQTRLILASQTALRWEMLLGALIAIVIIASFLRDRALTLVAIVFLPLALVFTAAAILLSGLRFDLMTIGGLAIAIGLMIDEAIVVVEAIARGLDERDAAHTPAQAIAAAVKRIAKPLVASTATIAVVFVPLGLLGGVPGYFFRALAITLTIALGVSIALSLLLAPALARAFGARVSRVASTDRFERWYLRSLGTMQRRSALVLVVVLALTLPAIVLLAKAPTNFLPDVDEGQFEIKYALPPGMSLAAADATATQFEQMLLKNPAIEHVSRLSGVDTNGEVATPPDAGTLRVVVRGDARHATFDELAESERFWLRQVNDYAAFELHQLLEDQINDLSEAPEPVLITVSGPDQAKLNDLAYKLDESIADAHGLSDGFDGVTWQARAIEAHARHGDTTTPDAFAADVRARAGGIVAGSLATAGGSVPVIISLAEGAPLERFASIGEPQLSSTIEEDNGVRVVRVTSEIESGNLSTIASDVEQRTAHIRDTLPPDYHVEIGGQIVAQRRAIAEFLTIFALALVLVYGVLLATFDSFRLPLIILATVPLAASGVAVALLASRTPLNIASFMGLLLLIGIVVRNGILLLDSASRGTKAGLSPRAAMDRAARERLRPIVMTTLATLGALAPLASGLGAGSEMERPLAIAVIGGIVTASAMTLAVVPLLYSLVVRNKHVNPAQPQAPSIGA